ncbi:MAG TPA: adenosylcobinamide-phosphate synthase CbiB [Solirubrobacteraceae bacterium]|jgi:adenosylcobinamide-phosphate synthase
MSRSVGIAFAAAADELLGDPARWHPVAGFGAIATAAERRIYRDSRAAGTVHTVALVVPLALGAVWLERRLSPTRRALLMAVAGWVGLGGRTLRRTALEMAELVDAGDLDAARRLAPALVARRPDQLDGPELVRAAVESLAENTADAVGGPLLWGAVAGPGGAVAHRAINTLDAMVGYRSPRYLRFGWCAARLDDALGWPVARTTAAATVVAAGICGDDPAGALRTWRRDAASHPSPNAGRAEAAFAGALGITLGGANDYDGVVEHRPPLGDGPRPDTAALRRAVRLSAATSYLLVAAAVAWAWR